MNKIADREQESFTMKDRNEKYNCIGRDVY